MTQLQDIGVETAEIPVRPAKGDKPAATITVRGLSSEDVMRLVKIHGGAVAAIFDAVQSGKIQLNLQNTGALAGLMLDQAPDIVADVIVIATDSTSVTDDFEIAKKLPAPTQLQALEQIAILTFVDGTPGEFLETVIRMSGGVRGLLHDLKTTAVKSVQAAQQSA